MNWLDRFKAVWSIDFEFSQPPGERPNVACLVAREFHSKQLIRLADNELPARPPFDIGTDSLFVAYFASAEWSSFLSLGWQLPARTVDLWCEFKNRHNGKPAPPAGMGLLGCLISHGLDSIGAEQKEEMRELAIRGAPFTADEMSALIDYCQTDVDALDRLLPIMAPHIDAPRALLRGRYMQAVARMEHTGVPIDTETLQLFRDRWDFIKENLIAEVDSRYGVFEGQTFKRDRFAEWLKLNRIPWQKTPAGNLKLDDDAFRQASKMFPQVSPLRELRHALSELKLEKLQVGTDGRNRTMLRPFASRTGRNQPSNNKFIFGPSVWLRGLIKPAPGRAVAYVDWSQQELGVAAALSGDAAMLQAYRSGDPYLEFARMAGAVPRDATKQSHPQECAAYKVCMLATQYGQREYGLADRLGCSVAVARDLLRKHEQTLAEFWKWSQQEVDRAMLLRSTSTVFGWRIHTNGYSRDTGKSDNPRTLANFPAQANGAEMLRLACCELTEAGINVCAPVHDAVLIEADSGEIDQVVAESKAIMRRASEVVLGGFPLESDAKIVTWPERYQDEDRGLEMWDRVVSLAGKVGNLRKDFDRS